MAVSFKFPLGCHCSVSVVFSWKKPFGLSCFPLVSSSFFFYKSVWNTLLSSLNPLGGKVPWSLGDFQSEQKPRQLPSPDEGEIETKSLGLEGK